MPNKTLLTLSLLAALTACQEQQPPAETNQPAVAEPEVVVAESAAPVSALEANFKASAQVLFHARPHYATVLGVDEELAGGAYNHRLDDYSPAAEAQMRDRLRQINAQLATLETANAVDQANQQVMMNLNRYFSGHEDFDIGYIDLWMGLSPFVVNQINGPLIDVPNYMVSNQKINSLKDAEDYLARLDGYDAFLQSVMAKLSADTGKGWIPPKVIIEKTIAGLEAFIEPEVAEHPLYVQFAAQVNALDGVTEEDKQRLMAEAMTHITDGVYSGYGLFIEAMNQLFAQSHRIIRYLGPAQW